MGKVSLPDSPHSVSSGRRLTNQDFGALNDIIAVISKNTCASGEVNIRLRKKRKREGEGVLNSFRPQREVNSACQTHTIKRFTNSLSHVLKKIKQVIHLQELDKVDKSSKDNKAKGSEQGFG